MSMKMIGPLMKDAHKIVTSLQTLVSGDAVQWGGR